MLSPQLKALKAQLQSKQKRTTDEETLLLEVTALDANMKVEKAFRVTETRAFNPQSGKCPVCGN
jgi:DNA repair exonuclease SbcCD ATPase subunit